LNGFPKPIIQIELFQFAGFAASTKAYLWFLLKWLEMKNKIVLIFNPGHCTGTHGDIWVNLYPYRTWGHLDQFVPISQI